MGRRGACGARLEIYVCARSAGDRWADRALLMESMRLRGQFSWVSISFVDRDLIVPKSVGLDVFPGSRLNCLARAPARGVRRSARTRDLRATPARAAPNRRRARAARGTAGPVRAIPKACRLARAPHSRAVLDELPRGVYMPFGAGPRVCIGNHFALTEALLILASCLAHGDFRLAQGSFLKLTPAITLRPQGPVNMQLERR
jgi:hypothetical protein